MAKEDFLEIDILVDDKEHIITVPITLRTLPDGTKKYSFSFMRDFIDTAGKSGRTTWLSARHINAIRRMLDKAENWFEHQEKLDRKLDK